jgi:hypothetical protein
MGKCHFSNETENLCRIDRGFLLLLVSIKKPNHQIILRNIGLLKFCIWKH